MKNTITKRIRRAIYKDFALREKRQYVQVGMTFINRGRRRAYLLAKRLYVKGQVGLPV